MSETLAEIKAEIAALEAQTTELHMAEIALWEKDIAERKGLARNEVVYQIADELSKISGQRSGLFRKLGELQAQAYQLMTLTEQAEHWFKDIDAESSIDLYGEDLVELMRLVNALISEVKRLQGNNIP